MNTNIFSDPNPNFKVGIAGDWHGDLAWALHAIEKFDEQGIKHIMHLGDFGIWSYATGRKYVFRINRELEERDMRIYVTLGNHENYNLVNKHYSPNDTGLLVKPSEPRILVFPRGFQWNWHGKKYMSFGGANSIDRFGRIENKGWWAEEQILDEQIFAWDPMPKVDIMFTHDVPEGVAIFGSHRDASHGWESSAIHYARKSRHQLRRLTDVTQPHLLFHGHYHLKNNLLTLLDTHERDENRGLTSLDYKYLQGIPRKYSLRTICMNMEYTNSNMGVLDPSTLEFGMMSSWGLLSEDTSA